MGQVDKIHWFPDHGAVNPSSPLLLLGEDRESHRQPLPRGGRGRRLGKPPRVKVDLAV